MAVGERVRRRRSDDQPSTAARIRDLRLELAALEQRQRDELLATIAAVVGSGVCFSARELFELRGLSGELRQAFDDAGIRSPKQLGKKLRQLGLTRIGENGAGVLWTVEVPDDFHRDP